jgi:prolyl 4-hydroxylase
MAAITHLSNEWRQWIVENQARGSDSKAMIADMIRQGFDPVFASSAVFSVSKASNTPVENSAYRYEKSRVASGNLIKTSDRSVRVSLRIERPAIVFFDDVLSHEECDELVRRSRDRLKRSTTVDPTSGQDAVIAARNSEGTFFPINDDPFIAMIDARVSALMNLPVENGEGLQILHYDVGGQYTPHFDYFAPSDPGSARHVANGGQRVSSLIMYLNDVEDGGSTVFPELKLIVGPKKGGAVYFDYCNSRDQLDSMTLHGGMPVLKGEKWIATKWMRKGRYEQAPGFA